MNWEQLLERAAASLGVEIPPGLGQSSLIRYLELLHHWNRTLNLTSLSPEASVRRLVAEPLWAARLLNPRGRYLDVGSGNGSPSVPWLISCDFSDSALVEPRTRRAVFLEVLVRRLELTGARVAQASLAQLRGAVTPPDWITLQGVRLDGAMLQLCRELSPGARIVWFTRGERYPEPPLERLSVPESDRELLIF